MVPPPIAYGYRPHCIRLQAGEADRLEAFGGAYVQPAKDVATHGCLEHARLILTLTLTPTLTPTLTLSLTLTLTLTLTLS